MRIRLAIIAVVAIGAAAVIWPQLASAGGPDPRGPVGLRKGPRATVPGPAASTDPADEVIRLQLRFSDQFREITFGPPGSAGNTGISRDPVHDASTGKLAGHAVSQCTVNFADRLQCLATIGLNGRGSITLSGTVGFFTTSDNLAITGGTGQFKRSRGEAHLSGYTDTGHSFILRLHD